MKTSKKRAAIFTLITGGVLGGALASQAFGAGILMPNLQSVSETHNGAIDSIRSPRITIDDHVYLLSSGVDIRIGTQRSSVASLRKRMRVTFVTDGSHDSRGIPYITEIVIPISR
jgi:hypothetical protein